MTRLSKLPLLSVVLLIALIVGMVGSAALAQTLWSKPGDPVLTLADADAALGVWLDTGDKIAASYDPAGLPEANDRIWLTLGQMADDLMSVEASPGPKGDTGAVGANGATGAPGDKGDKGDTGVGFRTDCGNGELALWNTTNAEWECSGSTSTSNTGGNQTHTNLQPSLGLQCIIALQGIFPSQSRSSEPVARGGLDPFIGEVAWVAFNFAPVGWTKCEGQLLPISSNTALFSLLGTTFGGDGTTTFGLPDMRGRTPVGVGTGPGLAPVSLGEEKGVENVTLTVNQIPSHNHVIVP